MTAAWGVRAGGAGSLVVDAEVVAVDRGAAPGPAGGTVLKAFQELSTRARGDITNAQVLRKPVHTSLPYFFFPLCGLSYHLSSDSPLLFSPFPNAWGLQSR